MRPNSVDRVQISLGARDVRYSVQSEWIEVSTTLAASWRKVLACKMPPRLTHSPNMAEKASKKSGHLSISSFRKMRWIHLSLTNVTSRVSCFVEAPLSSMLTSCWIDWNMSEFFMKEPNMKACNACEYPWRGLWPLIHLISGKIIQPNRDNEKDKYNLTMPLQKDHRDWWPLRHWFYFRQLRTAI